MSSIGIRELIFKIQIRELKFSEYAFKDKYFISNNT